MWVSLCKSKIHRARVTEANLHYEGSLTVDQDLLDAAGILAYEKVALVNINNGARLETYAISGARSSGVVCLNGAAARMGQVGDLVIIISYGLFERHAVAQAYAPLVVQVDEQNMIQHVLRGDLTQVSAAGQA